eukprot:6367273-Prymnesium_polylepis.1
MACTPPQYGMPPPPTRHAPAWRQCPPASPCASSAHAGGPARAKSAGCRRPAPPPPPWSPPPSPSRTGGAFAGFHCDG